MRNFKICRGDLIIGEATGSDDTTAENMRQSLIKDGYSPDITVLRMVKGNNSCFDQRAPDANNIMGALRLSFNVAGRS